MERGRGSEDMRGTGEGDEGELFYKYITYSQMTDIIKPTVIFG